MSRNAVKRSQKSNEAEADLDDAQQAPEEGGTPGVRIDRIHSGSQPNVSHSIMLPQDKIVRSAKDDASERAPAAKRYSVLGDHKVNYNNFPYTLRHGKVVSETTHDIPALKRQGVRLEALPPEEPEAAPEPPPASPSQKASAQVDASMTPVQPVA